ncbi:MAG: TerC family protein [Myxococcota bacterium]
MTPATVATVGSRLLWAGFVVGVLVFLALDLGVFHRTLHAEKIRVALAWTAFWIALSLLFNVGVYFWFGPTKALEFLTGYVIEKALSVATLFVFLVIFSTFRVPAALQHRVLFYGVLGALVLRALFIGMGAALIATFHWVLYVFGAFLIYTGAKLLSGSDGEVNPEHNILFRAFKRAVPAVSQYHGSRFWVRENGRYFATPLLVVLIAIESSDVIFAVDSIPAIFGITTDPFIVFTSNVFAILGLRSLYFALAGMMDRFHYLQTALAGVLLFIGAKMIAARWYEVPIGYSLLVVLGLLAGGVLVSLARPKPADTPAP